MNKLKLTQLICLFLTLFCIAFGAENMELKSSGAGGKLFCIKMGKTYCENVVNYPREEIERLLVNKNVINVDI